MYAIASILRNDAEFKKIKETLAIAASNQNSLAASIPHLSWLVASKMDILAIQGELLQIAEIWPSISIRIYGIGLFNQIPVVLYFPIIRSTEISRRHSYLWEKLAWKTNGTVMNYSPDCWIPHITIEYGDTTHEKIASTFMDLTSHFINLDLTIDNISIIYNIDGETGVAFEIDLQKTRGI